MTRIARYRNPKHPGRDLLDYVVTAGALTVMTLVNVVVFVPILMILWPFRSEALAMTAVLMCTMSNLVIVRGMSLFGQHMVRRWVFDHEQRHHEIVPLTERRKTRARF